MSIREKRFSTKGTGFSRAVINHDHEGFQPDDGMSFQACASDVESL